MLEAEGSHVWHWFETKQGQCMESEVDINQEQQF